MEAAHNVVPHVSFTKSTHTHLTQVQRFSVECPGLHTFYNATQACMYIEWQIISIHTGHTQHWQHIPRTGICCYRPIMGCSLFLLFRYTFRESNSWLLVETPTNTECIRKKHNYRKSMVKWCQHGSPHTERERHTSLRHNRLHAAVVELPLAYSWSWRKYSLLVNKRIKLVQPKLSWLAYMVLIHTNLTSEKILEQHIWTDRHTKNVSLV